MWDKETAPVQDVTKHVWQDEGLEVTDSTIRSTVSKASDELRAIGIPWTLNYRKGFILKDH